MRRIGTWLGITLVTLACLGVAVVYMLVKSAESVSTAQ